MPQRRSIDRASAIARRPTAFVSCSNAVDVFVSQLPGGFDKLETATLAVEADLIVS